MKPTRHPFVPHAPTDFGSKATHDIAGHMNSVLADVLALYLKTKNFQWHLSGAHFRDYHGMLAEQAEQLHRMIDPIAERIRKIGRATLRSIGHVARLQRVIDNDADYVATQDMLAELREDNQILAWRLRQVHSFVKEHHDVATASLIEAWTDETEGRTWFLFAAGCPPRPGRPSLPLRSEQLNGACRRLLPPYRPPHVY